MHPQRAPACENFLYGFKAARRAARAADSARSPLLPLALPQRRRKMPVGWREEPSNRGAALANQSVHRPGGGQLGRSWQLSGAGVLPNSVLSGTARTCQERLRRRLRRSPTLDRTCPKVPDSEAIESRAKTGQARIDAYVSRFKAITGAHLLDNLTPVTKSLRL
jgi:hypothetical protein